MAISGKIRKERNRRVTARLKTELAITVRPACNKEELKDSNWFIATNKGKGILKLQVQ